MKIGFSNPYSFILYDLGDGSGDLDFLRERQIASWYHAESFARKTIFIEFC